MAHDLRLQRGFTRAFGWLAWALAIGALAPAMATMARPWNGVADMIAAWLPLTPVMTLASMATSLFARPCGGRLWLNLAAILSMSVTVWHIGPELIPDETPAPSGRTVVIVTHNVHHGGASPELLTKVLAESGADILLLQENDRRSARALDALAHLYPYRDPCRACEQAILSRWPIDVHWRLPDRRGKPVGPPLFRADVRVPGLAAPLRVISLHAPRPMPPPGQRAFLQGLIDGLRHASQKRLIIAGDFNLAPWTATMAQLERDIAPIRRISRGQFTYPASIAGLTMPILPIDNIFASPDVGVSSIGRLRATGSDHLGLRATLWVVKD